VAVEAVVAEVVVEAVVVGSNGGGGNSSSSSCCSCSSRRLFGEAVVALGVGVTGSEATDEPEDPEALGLAASDVVPPAISYPTVSSSLSSMRSQHFTTGHMTTSC
jgi:hypothetical protein